MPWSAKAGTALAAARDMHDVIRVGIAAVLLTGAAPVSACGRCLPAVYAVVLGPGFATTLALLLLPLVCIALVALAVARRGPLPRAAGPHA
jgi:hypothetical protein